MSDRPHASTAWPVLALRTWLRYVVPLTLLSALAMAILVWLALKSDAATSVDRARAQLRLGWILAGSAWAFQILLVAGVTPALRSVATGRPLAQWRAFASGLRSLVRAIVPCGIAVAAVILGGLALVVPGLLLLVLVAMTGASERLGEPPPAAIVDSIEVARESLLRIALLVAAVVLIDLAIAYAAQTTYVPAISKKVAASKLLPIKTFVRTVALALVVFSPLAACAIAAVYQRARSRT